MGCAGRLGDHGGIEFTALDLAKERGREPGKQAHFKPRVLALERPQGIGKLAHERRDEGTHLHRAAQVMRVVAARECGFPARDQVLRGGHKGLAVVIQRHGAGAAIKERAPELLFERAHLQAHRGRGKAHLLSRRGKAAGARDREKKGQGAKVWHGLRYRKF